MKPIFYNTQHSPIGSFASFTLGAKGPKGGLGLELDKPADQNVFIGIEKANGDGASCLPFCNWEMEDLTRFNIEGTGAGPSFAVTPFADEQISRTLSPLVDTWRAGDLEFRVFSPVGTAPDPARSTQSEQRLAYVPALAVEMVVDNTRGTQPRRAFFGYQGNDVRHTMRRLDDASRGKFTGIGCGPSTAIASGSPGVYSGQGFSAEEILGEKHALNRASGLGRAALLIGTVAPGEKKTFEFVVCFYHGGIATTGMKASYLYTHFFADIEAVASYALKNFAALKGRGAEFDKRFEASGLNPARKFMLAQAVHSYFGSTELLEVEGEPLWIVNEGEYRMMNTFDLTVDQLFFEMEFNPWTVRNELDWFAKRYSYTDRVRLPGDDREYAGGISFAHDMGVSNCFSRPGHSVYEKAGLDGCFSHMTHEELVNWLVCALVYEHQTRDKGWLKKSLPVFHQCLESLLRRDHPEPRQRDGVMSTDSSRCAGGSEITTYDSLDISLGQARNNLYLVVKCWGVYVGLAALFNRLNDPKRAALCEAQAKRCAATVAAAADADGFLPAVLYEDVESRIIPAVEGLMIPYSLGLGEALAEAGPYGELISSLKRHLERVLQPGVCLFPDGGWKISSTSDNSWLSKVFLCQFIAQNVLKLPVSMEAADLVHASWLLDERALYWAWSDQFVAGEARGSKYYPRGVTSILWLK